MSTVKFLRDFQGAASGEQFYTAGTVVDLLDGQAAACVAEGVAELVDTAAEVEFEQLFSPDPDGEVFTDVESLPFDEPPVVEALPEVDAPLPPLPHSPARKRAARKSAKKVS